VQVPTGGPERENLVVARALDLTEFEAVLARLAADAGFSGAVVVTRGDEEIFAAAYGYANRAWRAPCTLETRFDTASITKLFTAVATLQLVERGAFGLDTSVIGYLDLDGTSISPAVTPYHLLTHTSGIADDADEEAGERYQDLWVSEPNYSVTETADHLPHFATKPPNFAPGEGCRYCNCGYVLLGLMIERATGSSYRDRVRAKVFGPASMERAGFFRMDVVEPDVAEGVEPMLDTRGRVVDWRRNIYSYPPIGTPDGGAYATVGDLVAFHRALLEGKLLGRAHRGGPDPTGVAQPPVRPLADDGVRVGVRGERRRTGAPLPEGRRQRGSQRPASPLPGPRPHPGHPGCRRGRHPGTGEGLRHPYHLDRPRAAPQVMTPGANRRRSIFGAVDLASGRFCYQVARKAISASSPRSWSNCSATRAADQLSTARENALK
jgi:CubicO group peptidase (beta-lactamase class C family)